MTPNNERDHPLERMYSLKRVAEILAVNVRTVRRWVKAGELPFYRLGRQLRVTPQDLDDFLSARREG